MSSKTHVTFSMIIIWVAPWGHFIVYISLIGFKRITLQDIFQSNLVNDRAWGAPRWDELLGMFPLI